jgi:phosphotransacetylase
MQVLRREKKWNTSQAQNLCSFPHQGVNRRREDLIVPVLVGPVHKIHAAADSAKLDLSPYEIVPTEHSTAAAAQAVALARAAQVRALMKGAIHTDELMHAVIDTKKGLRTNRRISHIFAMDAPAYPRPLFIMMRRSTSIPRSKINATLCRTP